MEDRLSNPFWHALCTEQAACAVGGQLAKRFPADIIPFAGVVANEPGPLQALHALLSPGELVYLTSAQPLSHPGLQQTDEIAGLQMIHEPEKQSDPAGQQERPEIAIERLHTGDIPAMLRLKQVAFPGFFGPRAASLGTFYGIRVEGTLIAMAGERLALPGLREISAVCTHPEHIGRGYAAMLIRHLLGEQKRAGLRSFLQAAAGNTRAVALYERLGFVATRTLIFRCMQRLGT